MSIITIGGQYISSAFLLDENVHPELKKLIRDFDWGKSINKESFLEPFPKRILKIVELKIPPSQVKDGEPGQNYSVWGLGCKLERRKELTVQQESNIFTHFRALNPKANMKNIEGGYYLYLDLMVPEKLKSYNDPEWWNYNYADSDLTPVPFYNYKGYQSIPEKYIKEISKDVKQAVTDRVGPVFDSVRNVLILVGLAILGLWKIGFFGGKK
jgi:hypothetical protein